MQGAMGLAPALASLGSSILLWACIGLLLALCLLLVLTSILFGGNRGRRASRQPHKGRGEGNLSPD